MMNLNEYQKLSKRTMPKFITLEGRNKVRANYALGIAGEAGEVADIVKKEVFHEHEPDPNEIKKELGDVMHYVAGLATLYGLTLEDVTKTNIKKLEDRYPSGFNPEDSINRTV